MCNNKFNREEYLTSIEEGMESFRIHRHFFIDKSVDELLELLRRPVELVKGRILIEEQELVENV